MSSGLWSRVGFLPFRRLVGRLRSAVTLSRQPLASGASAASHQPTSGCENLHERVRLLEAVVDNFPGGISLFDRNLPMVLCNEQQKRLLEYPERLFASGWPTLEQIFRFNAGRAAEEGRPCALPL